MSAASDLPATASHDSAASHASSDPGRALADALAEIGPSIEIVCAATPEAPEVLWIESTARALVWFLQRRRDELEHAWATRVPWTRQAIVETFEGLTDVDLGIDAVG